MCSSAATVAIAFQLVSAAAGMQDTTATMVDKPIRCVLSHCNKHTGQVSKYMIPDVKDILLSDVKQYNAPIVIDGFHALIVFCSDHRYVLQGSNNKAKSLHLYSTNIQERLPVDCTLVPPATSWLTTMLSVNSGKLDSVYAKYYSVDNYMNL